MARYKFDDDDDALISMEHHVLRSIVSVATQLLSGFRKKHVRSNCFSRKPLIQRKGVTTIKKALHQNLGSSFKLTSLLESIVSFPQNECYNALLYPMWNHIVNDSVH